MAMRGVETRIQEIRHRIFTEVARMAYHTEWPTDRRIEALPFDIMPGEVGNIRNDIFLERAIVGERLRLAMKKRWPKAQVIALDLALPMLAEARRAAVSPIAMPIRSSVCGWRSVAEPNWGWRCVRAARWSTRGRLSVASGGACRPQRAERSSRLTAVKRPNGMSSMPATMGSIGRSGPMKRPASRLITP